MVVNGLRLPAAFERLCEATRAGTAPASWELKAPVDAYGRPWDGADLEISADVERIEADTDFLAQAFHQEDRFQQRADLFGTFPGFVSDLNDVSRIVWFGTTCSGEPFSFDFRENAHEPCVICWTDAYWRRVAPNFESFMALFKEHDLGAALSRLSDDDKERLDEYLRGQPLGDEQRREIDEMLRRGKPGHS